MAKKDLNQRSEELSFREKKKLIWRFISVLLFGSLIGGFTFYFLFLSDNFNDFGLIPIIFGVFFFGILIFILGVHGWNAFQTKKKIYTGQITNKSEDTFKSGKSIGQSSYFIDLDGERFRVDLYLYNQVHTGDVVELHCLKGESVFQITHLEPSTHKAAAPFQVKYRDVERNNNSYSSILKQRLLRAFWYRTVLVAVICYFLYFILNLVCILLLKDIKVLFYLVWINQILLLIVWLYFNLKTYNIIRDLWSQLQTEVMDIVIDLQSSNLPKPSKNSVASYQGYSYRNDTFYYLQTSKFWIEISKELYEKLQSKQEVKIILAKHSKLILELITE